MLSSINRAPKQSSGRTPLTTTQAPTDQRLIGVVFKKCDHYLHTRPGRPNLTTPVGAPLQPTTALVVKSILAVPGELDLDPCEEPIILDLFVLQSDDYSGLVTWHPRFFVGQRRTIGNIPWKNDKAIAVTLMEVIFVRSVATGDVLIHYLWLPAFVNDLSQ